MASTTTSPATPTTPQDNSLHQIVEPPPLDSLLSPGGPQQSSSGFPNFLRESVDVVAETTFNEIALDDGEDIALDDRPVSAPPPKEGGATEHVVLDTVPVLERSSSTASNASKHVHTHQRTPSGSSHTSNGTTPFILARLDIAKVQGESDPAAYRNSLDGQQKLQEEFNRMQKDKQDEAESSERAGAIDWDFWGAVISDYQEFASTHPEKLAQEIEKGIPDTLRGMMWQLMAASKDPELEAAYLLLLKESSPHEKAIIRDLGRTFPHHAFFTDGEGIGQENLFNVLKAYSLYDTEVGYCQGLPFVVAILLLNMPDEEAFSLLVRLMYSYDLRGHFTPQMPKLQLRLFQFDRLLEELLPVLYVHFVRQGIKSSMFCSQWFLTLFSYRFPLEIVFRIYDNCLASGIEAIFGFSIMLLQKNEDTLLNLKFDEILQFFNTRVFEKYKIDPEASEKDVKYRHQEFVQEAASLRITPFMLDSYAHEWDDIVRIRDAHANEVDGLRTNNRALTTQVKTLEESLSQLNEEHVEVLNQLVMARLRNEEMEEELVRYKLLYAEAMHENEDAGSSHRISTNLLLGKRGSAATGHSSVSMSSR